MIPTLPPGPGPTGCYSTWRRTARAQRLPQDRLQRPLSASRQTSSLLLQTLCAQRQARPQTGCEQAGIGTSDGRSNPGQGGVDGEIPALVGAQNFHSWVSILRLA